MYTWILFIVDFKYVPILCARQDKLSKQDCSAITTIQFIERKQLQKEGILTSAALRITPAQVMGLLSCTEALKLSSSICWHVCTNFLYAVAQWAVSVHDTITPKPAWIRSENLQTSFCIKNSSQTINIQLVMKWMNTVPKFLLREEVCNHAKKLKYLLSPSCWSLIIWIYLYTCSSQMICNTMHIHSYKIVRYIICFLETSLCGRLFQIFTAYKEVAMHATKMPSATIFWKAEKNPEWSFRTGSCTN